MESVTTPVGVFGPGSPYEGQQVTHRGSQFVIEGSGPVDAIALVAWADAGQLTWATPEIGQWVESSAAPGSVPPPPTALPAEEPAPAPVGERRKPALVAAIVVLFLLLGGLGAYLIGSHSSRTATTTTGPVATEASTSTSTSTTSEPDTTPRPTTPPTLAPTAAPTVPPTVAPTQPPAPADPVNNANYARIQIGMTLAQVEAILGGPGRLTDESSTFGDQYVWERTDGGYGNISISIKDGVVFSKFSSIA